MTLATLPVHDWQFWVVTAIALVAAWLVLRMVVPARWWPWKKRRAGRPASLTIGGKTVPRK